MTGRMVGRAWELRALAGLLGSAAAGRGRGIAVLGDAGIGKTTLAAALADEATGFTVGWGRCTEEESAPYWPWRQALRAVDPDMPLSQEAPVGRAAVFGEIADRLVAATELRPALIILEDVHVADGSTLALLRFLIGVLPELRCVLLLTARDSALDLEPDAAEFLRRLPPAFGRITLIGLDRDETAELVASVLDRHDGEIADGIFDRTGGNPFFVTELARLHAARRSAHLGPPSGVGQVIGGRLARLPQRTHDCLSAMAVLGDSVDAAELAEVAGLQIDDVLDLLGAAVDAKLAVQDGTRYRFAHALVREVVYAELGAGQRAALHGRAADMLITRSAGDERAARIAEHCRHAVGRRGAAEAARRYALIAARAAARRAGYEQAARLYGWVLDGQADAAPEVRLELGEVQVLSGATSLGRAQLRQVAREYLERGDAEPAVRALLAMGGGPGGFEVDLTDTAQRTMLGRAIALLPDGDSAIKAAALARAALGQAYGRMESEARAALARSAVEMARRVGDARTEAAAIAAWCDTVSGPEFVSERITEARRMLELCEGEGDIALALLARRLLVVALLEDGNFDSADEQIAAYARDAATLRAPFFQWSVPIWRGMRALMAGDLEATDAYLAEAAALAESADSANAVMMVATLRIAKADATGTMPAILDLFENTFAGFWDYPMAQAYAAYFLTKGGERDRATRLVAQREAEGLGAIPKDAEWLCSVALLGDAARLLGRPTLVGECREALRPYADLWLFDGIGAACYGSVADMLDRFDAFLSAPRAGAAPSEAAAHGVFRRTGVTWELSWRDHAATLPDAKGLRDLAALLARPRTPVHVLDLVGAPAAVVSGGVGPVLDGQARAAYRSRLRALVDDIAEAERFSDAGRLARLRAEHDFIAAELAAALGLDGRPRLSGDPVERARKAVSMRIAAAIKAVGDTHPALGRHLKASVRTGRHCVYEPEVDVVWRT
jgi:hypothetical protein